MHDQVLRKIMATKGLPYTARCIWSLMATHKQGFIIKRDYLKQVLGVSEASIKSALRELRILGIVEEAKRKPDGTFEDGSRLTMGGKTAFGAAGGKTAHGSIGGKTTQLIQDKSQHSKSNLSRPRTAASPIFGEVVDLDDDFAPASTLSNCLGYETEADFDDPCYVRSQSHDARWEWDADQERDHHSKTSTAVPVQAHRQAGS